LYLKFCNYNNTLTGEYDGGILLLTDIWACGAAVAQGTHNPLVVGSNPSGPILILLSYNKFATISRRWFFCALFG
jgi:hypothetical protein